jgi:transposase
MVKIKITNDEKIILRSYVKKSPLILVCLKAQTILMAARGISTEDIADIVGRKERTVILWMRGWRKERMASIVTGHRNNINAGKLTREQMSEIRKVLQSPPSDKGLPKEFWDVPQLKKYISAEFNVIYESNKSYHFLLKFSNLSFKYPDTFDLKRDETAIGLAMKAIRKEINPLLADTSWEVFAADEVKMELEAITRRAWLKRGQRTVLKVNRDKQSQSYLGFLSQKSFVAEVYEMAWQNTDEVLKVLKALLSNHPDKKICIIWDNASFHKSKQLRTELGKGNMLERVHLIAMPPYAPDHNPIEHVWGIAKQKAANIQHGSFEATKKAFTDFIKSRTFSYSI